MKFLRQIQKLMIIFILFIGSTAQAELLNTNSMAEALSKATPKSLVVLDLDNTVMETAQMLGSDPFFGLLVSTARNQGIEGDKAITWAIARNALVQPRSAVHAVEPETPALIKMLQKNNVTVIGLTSRPPVWATQTLQQLQSLDISLALTAPVLDGTDLQSGAFQEGVYFLDVGQTKGPALVEIISQLHAVPDLIIFVDDKLGHVTSVESALQESLIPHFSYRYGAADESVRAFNADVARCEWNVFLNKQIFISDKEARELILEKLCEFEQMQDPFQDLIAAIEFLFKPVSI